MHTPGPWKIVDGTEVRGPSAVIICDTAAYYRRDDRTKDDARLIASAPDLVAALQALAIVAESVAHLRGLEREILPATDAARAAIAKALGE